MFVDFEAVQRLSRDVRGTTLHRRGLTGFGGRFVDLHVRLPSHLHGSETFTPDYCLQLGVELSNMDVQLYRDFILALFNAVRDEEIMGPGTTVRDNQIFLAEPSDDARLFSVLRGSLLSVVVNNFMSEYFQ